MFSLHMTRQRELVEEAPGAMLTLDIFQFHMHSFDMVDSSFCSMEGHGAENTLDFTVWQPSQMPEKKQCKCYCFPMLVFNVDILFKDVVVCHVVPVQDHDLISEIDLVHLAHMPSHFRLAGEGFSTNLIDEKQG